MNNPLGVSPSKGKQGTIRGKEKIFWPPHPLLGLTPSGLFMGLSSTTIYTSELILCSTICVSREPTSKSSALSYDWKWH